MFRRYYKSVCALAVYAAVCSSAAIATDCWIQQTPNPNCVTAQPDCTHNCTFKAPNPDSCFKEVVPTTNAIRYRQIQAGESGVTNIEDDTGGGTVVCATEWGCKRGSTVCSFSTDPDMRSCTHDGIDSAELPTYHQHPAPQSNTCP